MKELAAATMMIGAAAPDESLLEYKFGCCCWSRLLSVVRSSPGILRANQTGFAGAGFCFGVGQKHIFTERHVHAHVHVHVM